MPTKSKAQYNFMQMMKNNSRKKTMKGLGPSQKIAAEMISGSTLGGSKKHNRSKRNPNPKHSY